MSATPPESFEARATRLAQATRSLGPCAGFSERVMLRLLAEPVGWWSFITPLARRVVPVCIVVMLLAGGFAFWAGMRADETLAVGYGSVEVEW